MNLTKKEFKRAMCCGLGRVILELKRTNNKEKYKDIVLWACSKDIAYDAQSEGTRARYVYEMICCFEDKQQFKDVIIKKFLKCKDIISNYWDYNHYCELLGYFYDDGDEISGSILLDKYNESLQKLLNKRKTNSNIIEQYESLGIIILLHKLKSAYEIIKDIGMILYQNHIYNWNHFFQLNDYVLEELGEEKFIREMEKLDIIPPEIKCYLDKYKNMKNEYIKRELEHKQISEEELKQKALNSTLKNGRLSFKLRKCLEKEGLESQIEVANMVLKEKDVYKKARLLSVFKSKPCHWPMNPEYLFDYAENENESLRTSALEALGYLKSDLVREYALQLIKKSAHLEDAIIMLAENYKAEDEKLLLYTLKKFLVNKRDDSGWHGVYSAVFDIYTEQNIIKPSKKVLYYLYENTMCSFCREYYVREMIKRNIITLEIKLECRWDSNEEIRNLVKNN